MKLYLLKIVFIVFFSIPSLAQNELFVSLKDIKTSEPLSFATIQIKNTQRGFVADVDGQFRFPFDKFQDLPVVIVSSLGYQDLELDLKTLSETTTNIVQLLPQIERLETIILNATSERKEIINKNKLRSAQELAFLAVNAVPSNLDHTAHAYIGYYRDYQVYDKKYFNLNEGILKQFDAGINSHKVIDSNNQAAFYSYKQNPNFAKDPNLSKAYDGRTKFIQGGAINALGGNELSILNIHNPIRHYQYQTFSFVYKLTFEFLKLHSFEKGAIKFIDNTPLIHIDFKNIVSKTGEAYRVKGNILISLVDFKIHNFTYKVFDWSSKRPLFNVAMAYKNSDSKMYLNYITFNNRFGVANDFVFKQTLVKLIPDQGFEVEFNSNLDTKTLDKRDFYIKFRKRRISVKSIEVLGSRKIKLIVNKFHKDLFNLKSGNAEDLIFNIKNLKDVQGLIINTLTEKEVYQFREFFVQEVLPSTELDTTLKFIDKLKPLNQSPINFDQSMSRYFINSPLKTSVSQ